MAIENNDPWRTVLGTAFTRAGEEEIGWSSDDLMQHLWLLGRSGRGKSSTLHNLAHSLMERGKGLAVIDPHGDLSHDLLDAVPSSRVRDLIYFDPTADDVVTFNVVASVPRERIAATAADMLATFKAVWGSVGWGARMERILYFSLAALIEAPSTTLLCLPLLLRDAAYRQRILKHVTDPIINGFFSEEFATWDDDYRATAVEPVLNKVEQLLSSPDVRITVGTVTSTIDFAQIMDTRKVFIANLSKGRLGPSHAALLGSLLVSGFVRAALQRGLTHPSEHDRVPFELIVDELGTFATEAFSEAVAEARKYKLGVAVGAQYLDALPGTLVPALMANASNVIVYELSAADAERMTGQIGLQKNNASLLTDLKPGETWMKHATYRGPLHVYMLPACKSNGRWRASALAQHVMRNTYQRQRIEEKLKHFFARR